MINSQSNNLRSEILDSDLEIIKTLEKNLFSYFVMKKNHM